VRVTAGDGAQLPAKLVPPTARVRVVERRAALDVLAGTAQPLVVLSAPAGTGKTTALRQWVEEDPRPAAWVQLEESDGDPVVLLTYLARSLAQVIAVDPAVERSLGVAVPPVRERVLPLLAEALAAAPPFVLVLDDAHLLGASPSWEVVSFVQRGLPAGARLAVGSRTDLPLHLARMRASGEVLELGVRELAFDRLETLELLRLHGLALDEGDVDALMAATEGWATGLQLACLAAAGRPPSEWLPQVRGDRREVAAYFTEEVLEHQPADVQSFLLETSVLTELTPELCRLVTGRDDAGDLLARVAREELFVVPLGEEASHYRYHHLFAEMLEAELERRRPGRPSETHRRVADWCVARERPDDAIQHLLAAGDADRAADLVAASWPATWSQGKAETVRRWLESFSDRQILRHKPLLLTAGWIYTALDAGELGARWGKAACTAPMSDDPSPDGAASLRSSQALLRATVAADGVKRMREDAELAARLETAPGTSWYADAHVALGVARWLSGSAQRAVYPLTVGAREGAVHNVSAELAALGYLALVAVDEGDWEGARDHETRATTRLAELGFGTNRRCLPMLLARVRLLAHGLGGGTPVVGGGAAAAADAAADAERLLKHMVPHPWMALLAHVELGEAAMEGGDPAGGGAHAAAAAALLERYADAGILRRRVEHLRGAVDLARLSEPLTPAERRVLELLPTYLTEAQIAERLFVSRNTVKTHLKGLYRKLEAASRAEAVARARAAGLLPRA
jgi:LuxR family transcriptional regulator, maltose regulon positive regulatory protein